MTIRYRCVRCEETHEGVPALVADAPLYYYGIPPSEREARCQLDAETCVVDDELFFVRGCLDIPIRGESEILSFGLWTSLSPQNFAIFRRLLTEEHRASQGPFFGWLSAQVLGFPDCENLKTMVHLRDHGIRPFIELEPTDHPLAVAQREGMTIERAAEIVSDYLHGDDDG